MKQFLLLILFCTLQNCDSKPTPSQGSPTTKPISHKQLSSASSIQSSTTNPITPNQLSSASSIQSSTTNPITPNQLSSASSIQSSTTNPIPPNQLSSASSIQSLSSSSNIQSPTTKTISANQINPTMRIFTKSSSVSSKVSGVKTSPSTSTRDTKTSPSISTQASTKKSLVSSQDTKTSTMSIQDKELLITQVFPKECGVEHHHLIPTIHRRRRKRVVNGYEARKGQFPWQVALLFKGRHYCGGSIVHESYVVTGAHCFNTYTSSNPADWIVVAGDHRLNDRDMFEMQVDVVNITVHEKYISMWFEGITDTPPKNDIAVVKLKNPLQFNTWHIQPICILRPNITFPWGERCTISGWGHLEWNGSQPNTLNYAQVPLVSYKDCNIEKAYNGTIHDTALCAGYPQGQTDACEYDSGGPLSCKKCGRYYLNGIVSWGHECARPYKYGVYARMEILTPWMVKKIVEDILKTSDSKKFRNG